MDKCEISAFSPGPRHQCGSAISQLRSAPNGITGRDQCSLQSNTVRSVLLSFPLRDRLISEVSAIRSMRFPILSRDFGDFRNDTFRSARLCNFVCKSVNFSVPNPNKVYSSVDKCEISAFQVRGTITSAHSMHTHHRAPAAARRFPKSGASLPECPGRGPSAPAAARSK